MSWDIYFMKVPSEVKNLDDIDEDQLEPLGSHIEIVEILKGILSDIDFSDPNWGVLEREGYSIEFNIPAEDQLTSFALHIRGNSNVIQVLKNIYDSTGWRAIDGNKGKLDFNDHPERGLVEWQEHRETLINELHNRKKKWYQFWK